MLQYFKSLPRTLYVYFKDKIFLRKCVAILMYHSVSDNKEFLVGIRDYIVRCDFTAGLKNKYLPLCAKYEFGDYEIIVGSNQNSRKVSA